MAAQGMTDKEIAAELSISQETVSTYWRRVLLRYGAVSRTEVVAKVAEERVHEQLHAAANENAQLLTEIAERTRAQARELAQRNLLEAVTEASLGFLNRTKPVGELFDNLLSRVLTLTQSEYGFIGEIHHDPDGKPYLKSHAITNIAWNEETRKFYEANVASGLEFRNLETLFGHAIVTRQPVIANAPSSDERAGGLPQGHPPLNAFLGIPFLHGDEMVGLIGIANCPSGYDQATIQYLQPLVLTCSNLIYAYRSERGRLEAEQRFAESNLRLEVLIDHVGIGVLFEDASHHIAYANEAFCSIFQIPAPPRELVGLHCPSMAEQAAETMKNPEQFLSQIRAQIEAGIPVENTLVELADGRTLIRSFYPVAVNDESHGYLWTYREM